MSAAQQGGGELPQDERAAFEAWCYDKYPIGGPERGLKAYANSGTQKAWEAWQAALAQRAASVPAQAGVIYQVRGIAGKATPAPWHDVSLPAFQEKNRLGCEVRIVHAAPVPAASVQPEVQNAKNSITILRDQKAGETLKGLAEQNLLRIAAIASNPSPQPDIGRDEALLSAIRDGVPLEEPVSVAKAMMAQEKARVSLSGGTGPLAAVFLVNIQAQAWTHTQETATAYADGFNRGVEWLRSSIIEYADKLPTQAAPSDAGREAALEMKNAIIAVISYGHLHDEAPTAKFACQLLGAIERDSRVAAALATQAAPEVASVPDAVDPIK